MRRSLPSLPPLLSLLPSLVFCTLAFTDGRHDDPLRPALGEGAPAQDKELLPRRLIADEFTISYF